MKNFIFLRKNSKEEDYFSLAKEFITEDNRKHRKYNVITLEQMTKRHRALFPSDFVKNKTILDFGCCLGATGYWCLSAGAARYVGVETQKENAELASKLLGKYFSKEKAKIIHSSAEDFLINNEEKFDIVCLLGILYVFVDYYSILEKISKISKKSIVIESMYHDTWTLGVDFCGVQFIQTQNISLSNEKAYLVGKGTRISPKGLCFLMEDLGFKTDGQIFPEKILQSEDVFNVKLPAIGHIRYMFRFEYTGKPKIRSLSEDLNYFKEGQRVKW